MDGALDIAKLNFVVSFVGIRIDGEGHFEHLVLFLPVDFGDEFQPLCVRAQQNGLCQGGIAHFALQFQDGGGQNLMTVHFDGAGQIHGHVFVHAADLPGIVAGVDILEHEETVALSCHVLGVAARLFHADEFAVFVNNAAQIFVFQHPAIAALVDLSALLRRLFVIDGTALGRCISGGPAEGVIEAFGGGITVTHQIGDEIPCLFRNFPQLFLCPFMDTGDGSAGGDIVELVK